MASHLTSLPETAVSGPGSPRAGRPGAADDKEFMTTLAKGLAVLDAFGPHRPAMTLSQAAAATQVSRATARRILRTLTELGYVAQEGRHFSLTPSILDLGFSYLSTQNWIDHAVPLMKELSERIHESSSAAILQNFEIVYVARVPASRIMSVAISVGSRLPAFHTSMGRVQLGCLADDVIWRRLTSVRLAQYTPNTITEPQALFARIRADRAQGYSIVDEELETGLRSIAVPIVDRRGQAVAGLNLSAHAMRTTREDMCNAFLPALRDVAARISAFVN
ncbi:MAG: IclR family transcriptional regulator C-terminal domain-containing protein [Pseudorhodoplanes sp.]|jgi:IclR family pca regulon transcriptional regulator|nr:IclR family transcriptional regulator C-terminal domain-containing protein [Pseudorhodoplanes sp.]